MLLLDTKNIHRLKGNCLIMENSWLPLQVPEIQWEGHFQDLKARVLF